LRGGGVGEAQPAPAARLEERRGAGAARYQERAGLDPALDALLVELVAAVDGADARVERHQDRFLADDVAADLRAACVRGVDDGLQLGARDLDALLRAGGAVPAGDEHLDDLGAPFDLVAGRLAELLGAVAHAQRAPG